MITIPQSLRDSSLYTREPMELCLYDNPSVALPRQALDNAPPPSGREARRVSLFPCLSPRRQEVFSYGRENFVRYSIERSAVIGSMLTKMRRLPQSCRRCIIGRQAGSLLSWAPKKDFAKQKIFWEKGEKALSWLSGLPQKSRVEFCGKRSGRRIRSCCKRSAPQTQPPCRDEVGL